MTQYETLFLRSSLALALALVGGCSCSTAPCDFPVRCVTACGGTETTACGACPAGSVPISTCIDASTPDASTRDGGHDGAIDAATLDAAELDAPEIDAAVVCERPGYPVSSQATREERTAVETATAAFGTDTGVTVGLDSTTAAVTDFSGPFAIPYDTSTTDPCMRALDGIRQFFAMHQDFMRIPTDMTMRACHYDDLTDSEIVRLHGGTYDGRRLLGVDNDLVVHVTRSGNLRYFGGNYLPVTERLFPAPCFNPDVIANSVVGDSLEYTRFMACVIGPAGSIPITPGDTRIAGPSALYIDSSGLIHVAREVEVLLTPAHVGDEQINSDLYCCPDVSLEGCVGKNLIVDEIDLTILQQIPRCLTC